MLPAKEQTSFNLMAAVMIHRDLILESKKIKSVTASDFSPSVCHEEMGPDAIILIFNVEFQANFFNLHFHPHQEAF